MSLVNVVRLQRMACGIRKSICTACSMVWLQFYLAGVLWKFASPCKMIFKNWDVSHFHVLCASASTIQIRKDKRKEKNSPECGKWRKVLLQNLVFPQMAATWGFFTWHNPGLYIDASSACVQHGEGSAHLCFQKCLYSSQICSLLVVFFF